MLRFNFLQGLPRFLQKRQCIHFMFIILFLGCAMALLLIWGIDNRIKYQIKQLSELRHKIRRQSVVVSSSMLDRQNKKKITSVLVQYQHYRLMLERLHCIFSSVSPNLRLTDIQYHSGKIIIHGEAYNANVINSFSTLLTKACSLKVGVDQFSRHKGGLFGYSISAHI